LARRCRTSQTYISRIECGDVSPSCKALDKLLQAMGERLELSAMPLRGNQSTAELRADFEQLSPGERVAQAAELSYVLTGLAAGASGGRR